VKKLYYINEDLYRYLIGRQDQSVNEQVMIRRIDQQVKVNKIMIDQVNLENVENEKLRQYMLNFLEIITVISSFFLILSGTPENLEKKKELWEYIKGKDLQAYKEIRSGTLGRLINLPGRPGRDISLLVYRVSQRLIGFN